MSRKEISAFMQWTTGKYYQNKFNQDEWFDFAGECAGVSTEDLLEIYFESLVKKVEPVKLDG